MKFSKQTVSVILILGAASIALVLFLIKPRNNSNPSIHGDPQVEAAARSVEPQSPLPASSSPQEVVVPASQPPRELSPQVEATRRMYQAHASLRSTEVDDPDSETNQRIYKSMLAKAFSRSERLPQGSTETRK